MTAKKNNGFTLLETLVAFSILSISMTLFYKTTTTSLDRQQRSVEENMALALAKSQLALVGEEILLRSGHYSGTWNQDFKWDISIEGRPDINSKYWLFEVTAEVSWDNDKTKKIITLNTIMVGAAEEQT